MMTIWYHSFHSVPDAVDRIKSTSCALSVLVEGISFVASFSPPVFFLALEAL